MDQFEKRVETLLRDLADSEFPGPDTINSAHPARDASSVGGLPTVLVPAERSSTTRWPARSTVAAVLLVIAALVGIAAFRDQSSNVDTAGPASIVRPAGEGRTGTDPQPSSLAAGLADAKARWAAAGIDSYTLVVAEEVNYWSKGCRWITEITAGSVTRTEVDSSSRSQNCVEHVITVGSLHDRIARYADTVEKYDDPGFGVHKLEVSFNEFGVPETVVYDLANGSDEESSLRVDFTPSAPEP